MTLQPGMHVHNAIYFPTGTYNMRRVNRDCLKAARA